MVSRVIDSEAIPEPLLYTFLTQVASDMVFVAENRAVSSDEIDSKEFLKIEIVGVDCFPAAVAD
jgi:hypothetical protein